MKNIKNLIIAFLSINELRVIKRLPKRLLLFFRGLPKLAIQSFFYRVKPNLLNFIQEKQHIVWFLAILIGLGAAYAAILFRLLIGAWQYLWIGTTSEEVLGAIGALPWWGILISTTFGGLLVGLCLTYFISSQRAFGVADVIESRAVKACRIPIKDGIWSSIIASLSLGFGASAGREGPVVHLGATIASALEDAFSLTRSARRTLLASGVAAAVSASFNAPIAGVLFAHELILAHYAPRAFVPIVISSVLGTIIARIHLGNFPAFIIPEYQITSYWEFPAFALLGLVCGIVAVLFQFSLIFSDKIARNISMPLWLRPTLGGFTLGLIGIFLPQILGVGYDTTNAALQQQLSIELMILLLVVKTFATSLTLASRFGGGVFSPSMYVGAMTGGAFGLIAAQVFPEIASSNGVYTIIGMGAVSSAVIGAPISTTVIVFELTGGYEVTIALLLAISIATGLNQATHGISFFHWQLNNRGLFLQDGEHKEIVKTIYVSEFMADSKDEEVDKFNPEQHPWLYPDDSVEIALRAFDQYHTHRIAVVSKRDTSKVIGWADHWAALKILNSKLIEIHVEEHR